MQTAAATGTPDEAPLDTHTLAEFTGGDAALRREILLQFLAANEPDALDLRGALAAAHGAPLADEALQQITPLFHGLLPHALGGDGGHAPRQFGT